MKKYFSKLSNEMSTSPALMIFLWTVIFLANLKTYNGMLDLVFSILCIGVIGYEIRSYRRKYK